MIITGLVMLISALLTYKIAAYLQFNLQFKPLLFCAVCALSINFTLPTISIYFAKYHLAILIGVVFSAAFLISRYNDILNASMSFETPLKAAVLLLPEPMSKTAYTPTFLKETLCFPAPTKKPGTARLFLSTDKAAFPIAAKHIAVLRNPPTIIRASISEIVKNDMENAKLLKLTAVIAKLPSLDSILEYAYDQNRQKAYGNSIFAFKQALERYESDDYAPFIVIEIGNIYKNSGLYDEAIVIYNKAFSLPAVKGNEDFIQEFRNNIAYLRITKTTLLKHSCPKLSFSQIPSAIMQEIESEFADWRNQKHAS